MILKNNEYEKIYVYLKEITLDCPNEMNIPNLEDYAIKLAESAEVYFIQDDNKTVLGMVAFYANDFTSRILYITSISIFKKHQATGLGKEALTFAIKKGKNIGMNFIRLEVQKSNKRAIDFYMKNDMKIISEGQTSYIMETII